MTRLYYHLYRNSIINQVYKDIIYLVTDVIFKIKAIYILILYYILKIRENYTTLALSLSLKPCFILS